MLLNSSASTKTVSHESMRLMWPRIVFPIMFFAAMLLQRIKDGNVVTRQYPTIIGGSTIALIHLLLGNEYFWFDAFLSKDVDFFQLTLLLFNIFCFGLSWRLTQIYGYSSFDVVKCTGAYAVGYKLFFMKGAKNSPVRVFYPVDRSFEQRAFAYGEEAFKPYLDFADIPEFYKAERITRKFVQKYKQAGGNVHLPPFMAKSTYSQFLNYLRVPSITCAHLAKDFENGKYKLVPIIISHAQFTSGFLYQYCAHELASHGYLVMIPDHALCGSGSHVEFEKNNATSYDPRLRL